MKTLIDGKVYAGIKMCKTCKVYKPVIEFYKVRGTTRDTYKFSPYCKPCTREYTKKWKTKNPDKLDNYKVSDFINHRQHKRKTRVDVNGI